MSGLVESSADARSKTIGQNFRCRAWVNFNGTSGSGTGQSDITIRGSGNVSSITDDGTGLYTVNFTKNMPDVNYAVSCSGSRDDGHSAVACFLNVRSGTTSYNPYAVGSIELSSMYQHGNVIDGDFCTVIIQR